MKEISLLHSISQPAHLRAREAFVGAAREAFAGAAAGRRVREGEREGDFAPPRVSSLACLRPPASVNSRSSAHERRAVVINGIVCGQSWVDLQLAWGALLLKLDVL